MTLREPILFPRMYWAYIALAAADVLLTTMILRAGGAELNVFGQAAFAWAGITGATFFKFATVVVVLLICEYTGRLREEMGRLLAYAAVSVSVVPVTVGVLELTDAVRLGLVSI
ncbi:MAG: hypothetical protein Tsb0013_01840 [Phycisphaerales bacterium]